MGSIYKRRKVWYLDNHVKGQRIRKHVGASNKISELALKDAEVAVAKDEFGLTKNDIALDKLIERFLESSRANHATGTTRRYTQRYYQAHHSGFR